MKVAGTVRRTLVVRRGEVLLKGVLDAAGSARVRVCKNNQMEESSKCCSNAVNHLQFPPATTVVVFSGSGDSNDLSVRFDFGAFSSRIPILSVLSNSKGRLALPSPAFDWRFSLTDKRLLERDPASCELESCLDPSLGLAKLSNLVGTELILPMSALSFSVLTGVMFTGDGDEMITPFSTSSPLNLASKSCFFLSGKTSNGFIVCNEIDVKQGWSTGGRLI